MIVNEMFVGFERELTRVDLEELLVKEGYVLSRDQGEDKLVRGYEHAINSWPRLTYWNSEPNEEDSVPNWGKAGYKVISTMDFEWPAGEVEDMEEAERLAYILVRRFDGIQYDLDVDMFITKKDLKDFK